MNPDPTTTMAMNVTGQPTGIPSLEVGIATDPGREPSKQVNEDAAMARETVHGHLAVVCDGMGGHVGGKEASNLAIETIFRTFDATPPGVNPQQLLGDALRQANAAVYARGQSAPELKGMGSTCVAVLTHPGGSEIAHVGDSRVYLLTQGQVYQVTKDHSLVQRLVDANMLTPEQASNHPNANQITNAFGQRPDCEVEVRPQPFPHVPGDTFILCSDGFSDECGPQDLLQILAPHPPCAEAAQKMIDLANARGGHDNITVVIVRLAGGGPFAAPMGHNTPVAFPATSSAATTTAEMEVVNIAPRSAPPAPSSPQPVSNPGPVPQFQPPPPPPAAYVNTATPIEVPQPKSSKGLVIGIIIVLLLVVGGVAAAVLLRGKATSSSGGDKESDSTDEPSTSITPPASHTKTAPQPVHTASSDPDEIPDAKPRKHPPGSGSGGGGGGGGLPTLPPDTVKTPGGAAPPKPPPTTPSDFTK